MSKLILGRYTRKGLWNLFLMCALPLHIWTLVLGLRDLPWLTDRTNSWDALGVLSYGLVFAFLESLLVFLVAVLLGFLVLKHWDPERRMALLGTLVVVLSVWAMVTQLFFLTNARLPGWLIGFLVQSDHPLRMIYIILVVLVGASFALPAWAVLRKGRGLGVIQAAMDRLGLLAMLYLLLDVGALVIVVIRNV